MRWLWITAALAFLLDQGSKVWVFSGLNLEQRGQVDVWPPFVVFRPGLNTGINFGLFSEGTDTQRWILIAIALAFCVFVLVWARSSFARRIEFISAGLVIGGALGNVLDRVIHPGVLDFLNMSCCGFTNPYVFNIADVFIFAGAFGLALFTGSTGAKKPRGKTKRKKGA